jgi:hypothetical protein
MATITICDCPVCAGSGRVPSDSYGPASWARRLSSYDADTDTLACRNCGGQTMRCEGTGKSRLRADGTPCVHEYNYYMAGRCYSIHTCVHCGDKYDIDSGD